MAGDQRFRWWQEETPGKSEQSALERLAPSPQPLLPDTAVSAKPASETVLSVEADETDTWAELEAEAALRVEQAKSGALDSVSFYTDKAASHVQYLRFRRIMAVIMTVEIAFNLFLMSSTLLQWEHVHRLHIPVP